MIKSFSRFCILLFFFLYFPVFKSQNYPVRFRYFNQENGLSKNNILQVLNHPDSRVILVGEDAVYRADGYRLDKWIMADSLGSSISAFYSTGPRHFVLTKNKGVLMLDVSGKKITDSLPLPPGFNPDQILVKDDLVFLMISRVRLMIYNFKEKKNITPEAVKKIRPVSMTLFDGKIWIGHEAGLMVYDDQGGREDDRIRTPVQAFCVSGDSLILASGNSLIIRKRNHVTGYLSWNVRRKNDIFHPGGGKEIQNICVDRQGRIWFVTEPGDELYLYNPEECISITSSNKMPATLIHHLCVDTMGNVWAGTFDYGALCIQFSPFRSLSVQAYDKIIVPHTLITHQGTLLISTVNGFYEFDPASYKLFPLIQPDPVFNIQCGNVLIAQNEILVCIPSLSLIKNKTLYTQSRFRIRPVQAKKIFHVEGKYYITDIYDNLIAWDIQRQTAEPDTFFSLPDFRTQVVQFKKIQDTFYVLTTRGVYAGKQKKKFSLIASTRDLSCLELFEESGRKILVHQQGVVSVSGNTITSLFQREGIYHVLRDDSFYFLSGSFGLLKTDKHFNVLLSLNRSDGLLSQTIRYLCCSDKVIYMAGSEGIQYAPKSVLRKKVIPLTFRQIRVNGESAEKSDYFKIGREGSLVAELICPEFFFPEEIIFHYRLDNEGKNMESRLPEISLSDFSGGTHRLYIGVQGEDRHVLNIHKKKRFTETLWFWGLIAAAVVLLLTLVSWLIQRKLKRKANIRLTQERERNLLKHQAMNALLSPHFIYNSLASIQNYILQKDTMKASDFLARFARLIRMIIDKAREEEITLNEEIQRLTFYLELEKERFGNKLHYSLIVPDELRSLNPRIPNMIIQPYVENAILHGILPKGTPGHVKLEFKKEERFLYIFIEDDGVGLSGRKKDPQKSSHHSLATSTIRSILELNSRLKNKQQKAEISEIKDQDETVRGTRVIITLEL